SAFIYVDYTMPLAPLRTEMERIVRAAPEWDGRVFVLQVTDATERTMQLRILATAATAPLAFDLRCRIREGLIDFVQREYPDSLPKLRMQDLGGPSASSGSPASAGPAAPAPTVAAMGTANPANLMQPLPNS
ncbi:MAG: mechanosensitive ion channel protein MscS, partial [Variovorax sp.]|nr:mechanosensitive ion channel protein MscS [Variovorax sp.]